MPAWKLLYCGWPLQLFAEITFGAPAAKWSNCNEHSAKDILVYGAFGPCACDPRTFRGRILSVNGEDHAPDKYTPRTFLIGAHGYPFPYGAVEWLNLNMSQYRGPVLHHAVAYVNSNCVSEREHMVEALSRVIRVDAYGACTGKGTAKVQTRGKGKHWHVNSQLLRGYAFVLAAEHGITPSYVTEKPFVASAAGAIPIYWGSTLIQKFINPRRIVFWNASAPQLAVHQQHVNYEMRAQQAVSTKTLKAEAKAIGAMVLLL